MLFWETNKNHFEEIDLQKIVFLLGEKICENDNYWERNHFQKIRISCIKGARGFAKNFKRCASQKV